MSFRKIGKFLLIVSAGCLGLILLSLLAAKLALDRAPRYQAEIKEWVHQRIGYRIGFAHVSPAFRWYGPELYFDQLQLRSKDDRRVLARAVGGRVGADLWQLIRSGRLYALRIELDSPVIRIERLDDGKVALASEIELGGTRSLPALKLDDLPAGTLAIRHGSVTLQNWSIAQPQLALSEVNSTLLRGQGIASVTLQARLPPALGGAVSVAATARGAGVLESLTWTAHAKARGLSFTGWHGVLPEYLSRLVAGTGGFEMAARGQGAGISRADLDFDAQDVVAQLTDEPGVAFDQITGEFTLTHAADRWTLAGTRVRAERAGRRDPDSDFKVDWHGDSHLEELHARASYLRAETLLPLAGLLPQKDLRERLQEVAPTGEWLDTHVDLRRANLQDPLQFSVHARFRSVGFAPAGRAPGLRGLTGSIAGNESGGRVDIDTREGVFMWPAELSQPVHLDDLKTTLYWRRTGGELLVATPSIEFKNRDASVHGRVAWYQPPDGSSPVLTLTSSVEDGNVADTRLYLPKLLIAPAAMTWLNRAFVAGRMPHADIVIQGPIRHYPFRDGTGLFLARARLEGLTLDYKEGWPIAENLVVQAEFRNEGLSLKLSSGHLGNLTLQSGDAQFTDFKNAELQLHATVSGDAADALLYLRATPLDAAAEHAFSSVEAKGPMTADVDLFLPFKEFEHRRTLVRAHLQDVSLNRIGSPLHATELTGDADVDGVQVSRADLRGKVLGGPFQMQARAPRNRPVTRTILVFNGTLTGDAVHSALSLPAKIPIVGSTDWHGVLRMAPEPARERMFRVNSNLAGLDLELPEPLAKPSGRALPSSVEVEWPVDGTPQVRMALGSVLRGQMSLDVGPDGPTLGRVAVAFGPGADPLSEPPPLSDSQVVATGGTIDRLDLAGWLKLYSPDKNAKPLGSFLRTAQFQVSQIDFLGLSFLDVALELTATDSGWRIGIGGPNVIGSMSLPSSPDVNEPWTLDFSRLKFVDGPAAVAAAAAGSPAAGQVAVSAMDGAPTPHGLPAINFHAAELIWGERNFGDVQAVLAKLNDGISLKQLTITATNFAATAKGEWRGEGVGLSRLEGSLSSTDVGATMKDLGYDAVIQAKAGKLDFDVSCVGAPIGEALSVGTGHVQVALDKGQLTDIKPGAGRVLGIASLAALPRRLSLDFSDLTDKGLAFDTIRGDFDVHDGSAFTDNILVKGPAAEIGLIGRVGLKNKDYDQTVEVTGNVSSTLPLAAFVAGPVVGGAVLLFTQVFKQPLKGLARGYYRITGSWDNPTVERITSADAAAATAEAPK